MQNLPPNPKNPKALNKTTGKLGEHIARVFLVEKGYQILHNNFQCRAGELDIIAMKPNGVLAFIEVKCRVGDTHGMPYESVTHGKLKRVSKTIQYYLLKYKPKASKLAIEVISILLKKDKSVDRIHHFDNIALV